MGEPGRILLAEDNANDVELTLAALEGLNLARETLVVRDGSEALDYLYSRGRFHHRPPGQPAVVFLDIKMPKVSGFEVLRILKSDPAMKTIPVLMLTSSREQGDLRRCYEFGVNAYVVKPVDFAEFAHVMKLLAEFWLAVNELPPGSVPRPDDTTVRTVHG